MAPLADASDRATAGPEASTLELLSLLYSFVFSRGFLLALARCKDPTFSKSYFISTNKKCHLAIFALCAASLPTTLSSLSCDFWSLIFLVTHIYDLHQEFSRYCGALVTWHIIYGISTYSVLHLCMYLPGGWKPASAEKVAAWLLL